VFFCSNKNKVHIVDDVSLNAFASGAFISNNFSTFRIDLVDLIVDERGEEKFYV
jgi:hypothetical protein